MFGMVCDRIFVTDNNKVSGEVEQKTVTVGITKILCECPAMMAQPYVNYWSPLLQVRKTNFTPEGQNKNQLKFIFSPLLFRPLFKFLNCHQMTLILKATHLSKSRILVVIKLLTPN